VTTERDDLLVWIDLEMTGLDPRHDAIIEIATMITDAGLEVVAEGPELVIHTDELHLGRMIPIVQEMHARSGLTEQVRTSKVSLEDAEARTLAFVRQHCAERTAPLCGNSIWCDRMFLKLHMPTLDAYLHYRTIDVSSFKEVGKRWRVPAVSNTPRKGDRHRALEDIRDSIEELKHYRRTWLVPSAE